jgi:hypothetical protein
MAGGRLDFRKLLEGFREFWEACVGILPSDDPFDAQAALCVVLAYLQRVANFGGTAIPDYGHHNDQTRILTFNAFIGKDGQSALQQELVEIRVRHPGDADPLDRALADLDEQLAGASPRAGHLIIFDRRPKALRRMPSMPITDTRTPNGQTVTLLRA